MLRSLDLNTAAEKGLVKGFTLQTRARLSKLDANLPQVITVCEMVERGIGVVSLSNINLVRTRIHKANTNPVASTNSTAPWRTSANLKGDGRAALFKESHQGTVCNRDLCNGCQHACSKCCFQLDKEA